MIELGIVSAFIGFLIGLGTNHHKIKSAYWKGRQSGWTDCEQMVMDRATAKGYKPDIWKDLLQ